MGGNELPASKKARIITRNRGPRNDRGRRPASRHGLPLPVSVSFAALPWQFRPGNAVAARAMRPQSAVTTGYSAPVAQLDRALPSGGRGQRFESSQARHSLTFATLPRDSRPSPIPGGALTKFAGRPALLAPENRVVICTDLGVCFVTSGIGPAAPGAITSHAIQVKEPLLEGSRFTCGSYAKRWIAGNPKCWAQAAI